MPQKVQNIAEKVSFDMSVREEAATKARYLTTTRNKNIFLEARRRNSSKQSKKDILLRAIRWFNPFRI